MSRRDVEVVLNDMMFNTGTDYTFWDVQQAVVRFARCLQSVRKSGMPRKTHFYRDETFDSGMVSVDGTAMTLFWLLGELKKKDPSNRDSYSMLLSSLTSRRREDVYQADTNDAGFVIMDDKESARLEIASNACLKAISEQLAVVTAPVKDLPREPQFNGCRVNAPDEVHVIANIADPKHVEIHRKPLGIREYEPNPKHDLAHPLRANASVMDVCDDEARRMLNLAINIWGPTSDRLLYQNETTCRYYEFEPTYLDKQVYHGYRADDLADWEKQRYAKYMQDVQP